MTAIENSADVCCQSNDGCRWLNSTLAKKWFFILNWSMLQTGLAPWKVQQRARNQATRSLKSILCCELWFFKITFAEIFQTPTGCPAGPDGAKEGSLKWINPRKSKTGKTKSINNTASRELELRRSTLGKKNTLGSTRVLKKTPKDTVKKKKNLEELAYCKISCNF